MTTRELAIRIDRALVDGNGGKQSDDDRAWIIERYRSLRRDMTIHEACATARREWVQMVIERWDDGDE